MPASKGPGPGDQDFSVGLKCSECTGMEASALLEPILVLLSRSSLVTYHLHLVYLVRRKPPVTDGGAHQPGAVHVGKKRDGRPPRYPYDNPVDLRPALDVDRYGDTAGNPPPSGSQNLAAVSQNFAAPALNYLGSVECCRNPGSRASTGRSGPRPFRRLRGWQSCRR